MTNLYSSLSDESLVKKIFHFSYLLFLLSMYALFVALMHYLLKWDTYISYILLASLPLIILIFMIRNSYSIFNPAHGHIMLKFHKYIGKICRWLFSGWRPMIIRLVDIAIGFCVIRSILIVLFNSWNPLPIGINQTLLSPKISIIINGAYLDAAPLPGDLNSSDWNLLSGLSINASQGQMLIIRSSQSIFDQITYQLITTIWYDWEKIILLWFLIEVLIFAWNRSQKLAIEEVCSLSNADNSSGNSSGSEKTEKKESKLPPCGLASLLILHLDRISERYRVVDEKRSTPSEGGAGRPINAVMNTEGMGDIIQATIGGAGEFAVGPLKIPTSSVAALLSSLMRGPKITLSLRRTRKILENGDTIEGEPFLSASMTAENWSHSWFVQSDDTHDRKDSLEEKRDSYIEDMVREMAHKIFATLTKEEENISWKANYEFSEGLKEYRDSLFSAEKRFYHLKRAENKFLEALQESPDYAMAYYNLGVVYTELDQFEAAQSAFIKSIENESEGWQAYYALGVNLYYRTRRYNTIICNIYGFKIGYDLGNKNCKNCFNNIIDALKLTCNQNIISDYEKILMICDHVIFRIRDDKSFLKRDHNRLAKAYNLKGNTIRQLSRFNHGSLDEAITFLKKSVACAWMDLIISEINGWDIDEKKHVVSECMIDLADAQLSIYKLQDKIYHVSEAIDGLASAIEIDPANANLHLYKGKAYFCINSYESAALELEYAAGIKPENPNLWAHLALARSHLGQIDKALRALKKVPTFGPMATAESIKTAVEAHQEIFREQKKNTEPDSKEKKIIDAKEEDLVCRFYRASLIVELGQYSEKDLFIAFHLGRILNADAICGNDWQWRNAQVVLALCEICNKINQKNFVQCFELQRIPSFWKNAAQTISQTVTTNDSCISELEAWRNELIEKAIEGLSSRIEEGNQWKKLQNQFAIARLSISQSKLKNETLDISKCSTIKADLSGMVCTICECIDKKIECNEYIHEFSRLLIDIGKIFLEEVLIEDKEAAEKCFRMAMALLEAEHPEEIKRLGLEVLLAKSLHDGLNYSLAIAKARQAQFRDPLERENARLIGEIYLNHEDYGQSVPNLGLALSRDSKNPDNPDVLHKMGISQYSKALKCRDKKTREKYLREAKEYFERALIIFDRYNLSGRGESRCYLGRINMARREYEVAADYFSIVYKLNPEKRKGFTAGLNLALAHLKRKNYPDSEKIYREIINNLANNHIKMCPLIPFDENQDLLSEVSGKWQYLIDKIIALDSELKTKDKDVSLGSILASAFIGLASSYAERETNLKIALELVSKSDNIANKMDGQEKEKWVAINADCRGLIFCKITMQDGEDKTEEAIKSLKRSVSWRATPEAYLHLALAYRLKMQRAQSPEIKAQFINKARKCLKHAQDLDVMEQLSDDLLELEQSLEDDSKESKQEPEQKEVSIKVGLK